MATNKGKRPASPNKNPQPRRTRERTQTAFIENDDIEDSDGQQDGEQDGQSSSEGNEGHGFGDPLIDQTTQLQKLLEESKKEEKEPQEFQEAAAKQKDEVLNNLETRHDEMASMRDGHHQTITYMLGSTMGSTTPTDGSPPKLLANLLPATLDLNHRFDHALKGCKTLMKAFDDFVQEVQAIDAKSPPKLKRKWENEDKKGQDILRAACDTAETRVKERLGCAVEKKVKILDEEMDHQVGTLFDFERGGLLGQDGNAHEISMGSYVEKMKRYAEKITDLWPEDVD